MATPADNLDACAAALGSISAAMGTVASGLSGISSITGILQSISTNTQDTTSSLLQISPMIGIVNRSIRTVDVTLKTGFNGLYQRLAEVNNNLVGSLLPVLVDIQNNTSSNNNLTSSIFAELVGIRSNTNDTSNLLVHVLTAIQNIAPPAINITAGNVTIDFTLVIQAIGSLESTVNSAIGFAATAIVSELESLGMLVNGAIVLASSTTNSMLSHLRLMLGSLVTITDDASQNRGGGGGGGGGGGKQPSMKSFLDSLKGGLLSGIIESVNQGFMIFKKAKDLFRQAVGGAAGGGGGAKGGGNGMPPAMVGPMAAVTGVASAIGGLAGGFMTLIEMVGKFVGSLDPALMQQLNLAFENLSAVIGTGLRPLVSMAVVVIKAFGDALVPVMKQLEPVMTKLSMVIINMVVPYILMWADQIETLIPVIEALIPIIGFFGDLLLLYMKALIPPFKVLAGVLMIVVGIFDLVAVTVYMLLAAFYAAAGELKSWVPGFGDSSKADKQMAKDMVEKSKASAQSAGKAMVGGANLIIDGVENAFGLDSTNKKEKPKPGGAEGAAAKGASFSGVADLGKNMMQAAFGSSTANVANEQLNQQKQINQSIEKIGGWLFGWAKPREPAAGVRR